MIVTFSHRFKKEFQKLPENTRRRFGARIKLFVENKNHPQLNNHKLQGRYKGYSSINISGDVRVVYEFTSKEEVLFLKIGTHSQLY